MHAGKELVHEALAGPDLETRLRELREILPASVEREARHPPPTNPHARAV